MFLFSLDFSYFPSFHFFKWHYVSPVIFFYIYVYITLVSNCCPLIHLIMSLTYEGKTFFLHFLKFALLLVFYCVPERIDRFINVGLKYAGKYLKSLFFWIKKTILAGKEKYFRTEADTRQNMKNQNFVYMVLTKTEDERQQLKNITSSLFFTNNHLNTL